MRRARPAGGLHADAIFAVDHGRLDEPQVEADRAGSSGGPDIPLVIGRRRHTPIINPRQPRAAVEPRFPKSTTTILLLEMKGASVHVADREMGELQIFDDKARR